MATEKRNLLKGDFSKKKRPTLRFSGSCHNCALEPTYKQFRN